jgi:hypothetical protein
VSHVVRALGKNDVVVRYAGRRLRITASWCEVSDDAFARLMEVTNGAVEEGEQADLGAQRPRSAESAPEASSSDEPTGNNGGDVNSGDEPDKQPDRKSGGRKG